MAKDEEWLNNIPDSVHAKLPQKEDTIKDKIAIFIHSKFPYSEEDWEDLIPEAKEPYLKVAEELSQLLSVDIPVLSDKEIKKILEPDCFMERGQPCPILHTVSHEPIEACIDCADKVSQFRAKFRDTALRMEARYHPLFKTGNFTLHSGSKTNWFIDCEKLSDEDWDTLALIIAEKYKFCEVIGIPKGGLKLAKALTKYKTEGATLIVDDVLTTGNSMEEEKAKHKNAIGVVIFSRGDCPSWVYPLFQFGSQGMEARCQKRIEGIFEEIENHTIEFHTNQDGERDGVIIDMWLEDWQALKEKGNG